ncbi:MAG: hypothetical protein FWJ59_05145 [Caldicoprobacter sp.]
MRAIFCYQWCYSKAGAEVAAKAGLSKKHGLFLVAVPASRLREW